MVSASIKRRKKMTTQTNKNPSHNIFQVIERQGADSIWNKIGAAWIHQDGKGFNLQFNVIPMTGRVVIRKFELTNKEKAA
jgi:hypothetical protein